MLLFVIISIVFGVSAAEQRVGDFKNLQRGIAGTVYIVDDQTLRIDDFAYDGAGPDAFFYVGTSGRPSGEGVIVPYPNGADPSTILERHSGSDITLKLPTSIKAKDIKWISVWCRRFAVNFGELIFPEQFSSQPSQQAEDDEDDDDDSGSAMFIPSLGLTAILPIVMKFMF